MKVNLSKSQKIFKSSYPSSRVIFLLKKLRTILQIKQISRCRSEQLISSSIKGRYLEYVLSCLPITHHCGKTRPLFLSHRWNWCLPYASFHQSQPPAMMSRIFPCLPIVSALAVILVIDDIAFSHLENIVRTSPFASHS